jgi:hypothetical protein
MFSGARRKSAVEAYVGAGFAFDLLLYSENLQLRTSAVPGIVETGYTWWSGRLSIAPELVLGCQRGRGHWRPFFPAAVQTDFSKATARVSAGVRF